MRVAANTHVNDRAQARSRARGFTLIELLVALTLFGLISVVVMGGLRFGTRVWETGGARAEAAAEIESVQGILRRYISQAMIPQPFGRAAVDAPLFVGDPDRLRLVTVSPAHIGLGGLYQVEIWRAEDTDGDDEGQGQGEGEGEGEGEGTLELAWQLFRPDDPRAIEQPPGEEDTLAGGRRTLLSGVKSVSFAYFDPEELEFGSLEWEDAWSETDLLPVLISVRIEFTEPDRRFWPEFVVQTRLARAGQ